MRLQYILSAEKVQVLKLVVIICNLSEKYVSKQNFMFVFLFSVPERQISEQQRLQQQLQLLNHHDEDRMPLDGIPSALGA